jgi:hypothetical protein
VPGESLFIYRTKPTFTSSGASVAIEGGTKHDARRKPITDTLVKRDLTMTLL